MEMNQFHDLFVQKQHIEKAVTTDSLFMDTAKPLMDNNLSVGRSKEIYWLNTPLLSNPKG